MTEAPPSPKLRPPGANSIERSSGGKLKKYTVLGAAGLLLVIALSVLFLLPKQVNHNSPPSPASLPQVPPQVSIEPIEKNIAQQDAGMALQAFLRMRAQPDLQQAESWAPLLWQQALNAAGNGDEHFGHGRYEEARSAYQAATQVLVTLQSQRADILRETLVSARALLKENKIASAIEYYQRVLTMQADHTQALSELAQAQVREQVLEAMHQGQQAEQQNQLSTAAEAYQGALSLDSAYSPASKALSSVQQALEQQAYQDAMSLALSAIKRGDFQAANTAIQNAAALQPNNPAVQDALKRLQTAQKQASLESLRRQAGELSAGEKWSQSAELYQRALKIDSQASFARSGLEQANARLKLHAQLDHYLDDPARLASDIPLSNAQRVLDSNPAVPSNEPLLAKKITALRAAVSLSSTPVGVIIESDKLTDINVFHVARLGSFHTKTLQLRPGQYTATGTRVGYRDVRQVFTVSPGQPMSLTIRCEDKF